VSAPDGRRLVLVVGVGRSGTSLLTGILGQLGFHVPRPEVEADDTNPRGFSEPRWVVDFHTRLLRARRVTVNDSRPVAFQRTGETAQDAATRAQLRTWLSGQFDQADAVVVKDPRTSWFLPLWTACARELALPTSFVTMLRHPTEVIASARKSYGDWQPEASRAAAWVNVTLETELATRGSTRAFVRYEDLLSGWRGELERVQAALGVPLMATATEAQAAGVDAFVDPALHRNRGSWADREVPDRVRDLAEDVWRRVQPLARDGADEPAVLAALDEARAAYGALHAEAEVLAHSVIVAARPRQAKPGGAPAKPASTGAPSLRVRLARQVPVRYRRRLRHAWRSLAKWS
jgi:hypothetical protein